jgi:hypothetical protein
VLRLLSSWQVANIINKWLCKMILAPAVRFEKYFLYLLKFLGREKRMCCRCIPIFVILVVDLDTLAGLFSLNIL